MKRICIWLWIIALGMGLLSGCSGSTSATVPASQSQPTPSQAAQGSTEPTETQGIPETLPPDEPVVFDNPIGDKDTYWVASQWHTDDDDGPESTISLPSENWYLDLMIRVDGTARFRDIHEGVCLMNDSYLDLVWECTPAGEYFFYCVLYPAPVLQGTFDQGVLQLTYMDATLTLEQADMPQTVGQLYTPSELAGTWVCVLAETEGYQWEAMPDELSSITISVVTAGGPLYLSADIEDRDHFGDLREPEYGQPLEILQEPLFNGCANGLWSVRIGPAASMDANGFPSETEYYATIVGEDQLLLQRYYTLDGSPAVSYQTYWRVTDLSSWMTYESMALDYSNWVLTGYETVDGDELPLPSEMEDLTVILSPEESCSVYLGGVRQDGQWRFGNGGVVLLRSYEDSDEPFWFGGAICGYWVDTADRSIENYQMALYYQGGILKLMLESHG